MELPFAVESPERTSQLLPTSSSGGDDGSSLVTTSSQGSFLGSSSGTGGFGISGGASPHHNNPQQYQQERHHHQVLPPTLMTTNTNTNTTASHKTVVNPLTNTPTPTTRTATTTTTTSSMRPNHPTLSAAPNQPQQHILPSHHHHVAATNTTTTITRNTIIPAPLVTPLALAPAPAPPPSTITTTTTTTAGRSGGGGGLTSGLNIFGNLRVPGISSAFSSSSRSAKSRQSQQQQQQPQQPALLETIDFTYVNVCETDADEVDITLDGQHTAMDVLQGTLGEEENNPEWMRGDILTVLLSGAAQQENSTNEILVRECEEANQAANQALEAKREGNLQGALDAHAQAARQFREAAVLIKDRNASMANSLLLLSQTQAKSALALKRIVKEQPLPLDSNISDPKNPRSKILTQKDRLRAAVRGALVTRNEEEMSDSAFLGRATKGPMTSHALDTTGVKSNPNAGAQASTSTSPSSHSPLHNPVDDMMELERELRDMDMALELGNSIASLDARTQNRLKNSFGVDGSFMVVPPGSQSYMSSSNMWTPSPSPSHPNNSATPSNTNPRGANKQRATTAPTGTAGVRARANRVQNILEASTNHPRSPPQGQVGTQQQQHPHYSFQHNQQLPHQSMLGGSARNPSVAPPPAAGLESSWWGASSTTSQVLTSSVISLGASGIRGGFGGEGSADANVPANTKQLMRLMDALKTLGDENANLLREVEQAEAARNEAKACREQMARFKAEYGKRFAHLRAALEKVRKNGGGDGTGGPNPVMNSEYMRTASTTEQLQRQEQLIRKLTADLKKEKEESKKKDQALRKYESFYREVKARSAQKAAQRQREAAGGHGHQRPPQSQGRKTGQR